MPPMKTRACLVLPFLLGVVACEDDANEKATNAASSSVTASVASPTTATAAPLATSTGPEPKPPAAPKLEEVEGSESVSFTFAPVVDRPFTVETVRVKQKRRSGSQFGREVLRTVKRVTVTKEGESYLWRVAPVDFSVHGQRTSRVDELVEKFAVAYRLDSEGDLVAVTGYDDLSSQAKTFLRPKTQKQLGPSLTPEALRRTREQEWQGRVADLVGQKVTLGEPFVAHSEITLPKGSAPVFSVIRFGPWLDCPPPLDKCLRIESRQHTHVDELAKATGLSAETIRAAEAKPDGGGEGADDHDHPAGHDDHAHGATPSGPPPIAYAVHSVRIVDPDTSLPLWERIERNIDLGIAQLADTATSRYEYPTE